MNIKNSKICLIGLGYVGLPLAIAFAKKFQVIGYDNNPFRIKELAKGYDRTFEVTNNLLNSVKKILLTHQISAIQKVVIYILLLYQLQLIKLIHLT